MATPRPVWAIPISLILAFALLLAMALTSVYLSARLSSDARATGENQTYGRAIADVVTNSRDAETGQRGYLLTGDAAYLAPYEEAIDKVEPALERVRTTEASVGRHRYARLAPPVRAKLKELRETVALERAGQSDLALAKIKTGEGLRSMAVARRILAEERQWVRDRTFEIAGRSLQLARLLTAGLIASAVLIIAASLLFLRQLRREFGATEDARQAAEAAVEALMAENAARERAEGQVRQLQKMESLGQLTGGIAHDFNNMLAAILGGLDLARRRLTTDPVKAAANLDNATEAAQRCATLTSRLLAFARRQPLAPAAVDLNALVAGMSDLLERTLGPDIRVETVAAPGLWRCYADAAQVESAILNLAVNARDAMHGGGVLTIKTGNARVAAGEAGDLAPGDYATVSVRDTGEGMSAEIAERAFDPFFTTKEVGKGTGLGLSQVFGFARQSGGQAAIRSEPGAGTIVTLHLPRYLGGNDAAATMAAGDDAALAGAAEAVLVVEDEDRVRRFAVDALGELGYAVIETASPVEALELLARNAEVRLLFTDIMMPGMTGRELARQAAASRPGLRVLFTTGYASNSDGGTGDGLDSAEVLHKPYAVADLARKVREALDAPMGAS